MSLHVVLVTSAEFACERCVQSCFRSGLQSFQDDLVTSELLDVWAIYFEMFLSCICGICNGAVMDVKSRFYLCPEPFTCCRKDKVRKNMADS